VSAEYPGTKYRRMKRCLFCKNRASSCPGDADGILLVVASGGESLLQYILKNTKNNLYGINILEETSRDGFIRKSGLIPRSSAAAEITQCLQKSGTIPRRCIAAHKSFF
jgi:hypothetical protein